jgi:hypothetical protein
MPTRQGLLRSTKTVNAGRTASFDGGLLFRQQRRGPVLTKAELRAQGDQAIGAATKPIVKLPTKITRQCGRCGDMVSVMVDPGEPTPPFKCKRCD